MFSYAPKIATAYSAVMRARNLLIAAAFAAATTAQCPFLAMTESQYGSFCPTMSGPRLFASFQPGPCILGLNLVIPTHTNSTPLGGWIAFSFYPQQQLYPYVSGCARMSNPFVIVPVGTNGLLSITLPPTLSPFTLYADAVASYNTFLGPELVAPMNGLQLGFQ